MTNDQAGRDPNGPEGSKTPEIGPMVVRVAIADDDPEPLELLGEILFRLRTTTEHWANLARTDPLTGRRDIPSRSPISLAMSTPLPRPSATLAEAIRSRIRNAAKWF
jgi:hypothetical protein